MHSLHCCIVFFDPNPHPPSPIPYPLSPIPYPLAAPIRRAGIARQQQRDVVGPVAVKDLEVDRDATSSRRIGEKRFFWRACSPPNRPLPGRSGKKGSFGGLAALQTARCRDDLAKKVLLEGLQPSKPPAAGTI